jgi:hypothetical protein
MLNILGPKGNTNQNCIKMSPHLNQNGYCQEHNNKKRTKTEKKKPKKNTNNKCC